MKKRKVCYFLIFFVFCYLFVLLSPSRTIGLHNYIYSYVLVDNLVRNAPFKEYASHYSYRSFDRFTEGGSGITYSNIPFSEVESVRDGLESYLMSSLEVDRAPAEEFDSEGLYRYRSVENERKSFVISVYEYNGVKNISFSEDTEPPPDIF
ncbi:hypothetical protein [Providencia sp. Me31A]|uniref:hypothetical protein n=1 Tax=Providencia sp. Me31A TaxID=3392637 RepID=UPI003D27B914